MWKPQIWTLLLLLLLVYFLILSVLTQKDRYFDYIIMSENSLENYLSNLQFSQMSSTSLVITSFSLKLQVNNHNNNLIPVIFISIFGEN